MIDYVVKILSKEEKKSKRTSFTLPIQRIKLVAVTTPTLIKDLVLTLSNIFDLLSIKTKSSILDKAWSFYHKKKTPKSLRITYAILYYSMYEKSPTEEYLQ